MTLAAFLPPNSVKCIGSLPVRENFIFAHSWIQLDLILAGKISAVILDPSADGSMNIEAATRLLKKHSGVPMLAYVPLSGQNLNAVVKLSRAGLSQVLLHPVDRIDLWEAVRRTLASRLVGDFLGFIGMMRAELPAPISQAIEDLFERPGRYETAGDIALQAESNFRRVYRRFAAAKLGSPKRFLTAAKLVHGYTYLRFSPHNTSQIARRIGYADPRVFASHIHAVFGCCPASLRFASNEDEILMHLWEWFSKPSNRMPGGRHVEKA